MGFNSEFKGLKQWFIQQNKNDRGFNITPLIETIDADT